MAADRATGGGERDHNGRLAANPLAGGMRTDQRQSTGRR